MAERELPLSVFHFDCFWMREFHWCDFEWDPRVFPDPAGMLARLKERGLQICVWINPYIAQRSPLFAEGRRRLSAQAAGRRRLAAGPVAARHGARRLHQPGGPRLVRRPSWRRCSHMGVDCFKTDFGERIPTDVVYFDGSDPERMHNYYTYLYNQTVFDVLRKHRGEGEAVVFARSATAGQPAVPGALGRRLRGDVRVDGRDAARRAVARAVRLRLLEPRHRRLRGHPDARAVQALDRVRPALLAQPAARQRPRTACRGCSTRRPSTCCGTSPG